MHEINPDIHIARLNEIQRQANRDRLVRSVSKNQLQTARQAIGRGLVNVGKHLLNDDL